MEEEIKFSIIEHFNGISDKRRQPLYKLSEILTIVICGTIAGADGIVQIVAWAQHHLAWLESIIELPYGIPSHDTIGRVLSIMDPEEFEECFIHWTNAAFKRTNGDIIPIDGKLLNGSYDSKSGIHAINVVGAFSTANGVLLGQVKTKTKSNEITAIPKLLQMLKIKGCIITTDAMGCQTDIASAIIKKEADYVLAVKDNQPTLHKEIRETFEAAFEENSEKLDFYETTEKGHGREETRRYYCINDIEDLEKVDDFSGCSAIGMVESTRTVNGKTSIETRYFILSFISTMKLFAQCVRKHWHIENSLHWVLDVAFREDQSRIRKDNTPANMAIIRRVGVNMLKQEKTKKVGVETKRKSAGWDTKYLEKILGLC
jgi:predicted transposase YbfD/YdcC